MSINPVVIDEGAQKIVLFEGNNGQWYIRGYTQYISGFLSPMSHEKIIIVFAWEVADGFTFEPRGGACLPQDKGFQVQDPGLHVYGKSTYCGPIQNRHKLEILLEEAFPEKRITLDLS